MWRTVLYQDLQSVHWLPRRRHNVLPLWRTTYLCQQREISHRLDDWRQLYCCYDDHYRHVIVILIQWSFTEYSVWSWWRLHPRWVWWLWLSEGGLGWLLQQLQGELPRLDRSRLAEWTACRQTLQVNVLYVMIWTQTYIIIYLGEICASQ